MHQFENKLHYNSKQKGRFQKLSDFLFLLMSIKKYIKMPYIYICIYFLKFQSKILSKKFQLDIQSYIQVHMCIALTVSKCGS